MPDPVRAAKAIVGDLAMIHEPGYGTAGTIRAFYMDDLVVVADDIRLTESEHAMLACGRGDRVRDNRVAFQYVTGPLFVSLVEQATGRRVVAFSGEVHIDPLFEVAVFRLAPAHGRAAV